MCVCVFLYGLVAGVSRSSGEFPSKGQRACLHFVSKSTRWGFFFMCIEREGGGGSVYLESDLSPESRGHTTADHTDKVETAAACVADLK